MGIVAVTTISATDETVTKDKLNGLAANLVTEFNGNIDNDNIKAGAGIVGSKLNLAAPGAIGGTTPAAGAFTTLTSNAGGIIMSTDDLYTAEWGNWADHSVTGFSALTNAAVYVKKVGKLVFVQYVFSGTSNAVTITFELPYACNSSLGCSANSAFVIDNSTVVSAGGYINLPANDATCSLLVNTASGEWTASGTKQSQGQFFYESAT